MHNRTLEEATIVNRERSAIWHQGGVPWSLADWSNAMCGEAGELANMVKKIRRIETNTHGRYTEKERRALVEKAKLEVADVFMYLDLLLEQLDSDATMYDVVAKKFNITSLEYGFHHRLPIPCTNCDGKGHTSGSRGPFDKVKCGSCHGSGVEVEEVRL